MAEDRDYQMLIALAKRKYNNDDKAIELFKKIAANQVEFHRGHSDLLEGDLPDPLKLVGITTRRACTAAAL